MSKMRLGTFFWPEAARKTSDVMYTGELTGVRTVCGRYLAGRLSLLGPCRGRDCKLIQRDVQHLGKHVNLVHSNCPGMYLE